MKSYSRKSVMAVRRLILVLALFAMAVIASADNEDLLKTLRFTAPKKYALVIGAKNYSSMGALRYSTKDARDFASCLKQNLEFDDQHITLLVDDDKPELAPTSKNILSSLDRLLADKSLDKSDLFIFYFSGHGVGTDKGDFLAPTDATMENVTEIGLPVREITKRFASAGMRNVLIIADACRAGTANGFGEELEILGDKSNLAVLLSTTPGKRSYELAGEKHGAFTYALLRAIADPTVRDSQTGGLWATQLAQRTSEETFKLTEPNYGKYAQKPVAWNERRKDVLLASFRPTAAFESQAIDIAASQFKKMDRQSYGDAIYAMALAKYENCSYDDAIRLLQTLSNLGQETPKRMLLLANALDAVGRDAESVKVYDKVIEAGTPYLAAFAILSYPTSKYDASQRFAAAKQMWEGDGDFVSAEQAYEQAPTAEDQLGFGKLLITYYGPESGPGTFFAGANLYVSGDSEKALPLLRKAETMGDEHLAHYSLIYQMLLSQGSDSHKAEVAIESRGAKLPSYQTFWGLQLADSLKYQGREAEAVKLLAALITKSRFITPDDILGCLDSAGSSVLDLAPAIALAEKRFPDSWQVIGANFALEAAKDFSHLPPWPSKIDRFSSNPVEVRSSIFRMIERINKASPKPAELSTLANFFLDSLAPYSQDFEPDELLWGRLSDWALATHRNQQLYQIASKQLFPKVLAGKVKAEVIAWALTICEYAGQDAMAAKMYEALARTGLARRDEGWQYLTYLVVRGDHESARKLMPTLPKPGAWAGGMVKPAAEAFFSVLDRKSDARATLDAVEPDGIESIFLWIMANNLLGGEERANRFFTSNLDSKQPYPEYICAYQLTWLLQYALEKKDSAKADDLAFRISRAGAGPLYAAVGFDASPKLTDFVRSGDILLGGERGSVKIDAKGHFTFNSPKFQGSGTVDKLGNLTGTGKLSGKAVQIQAKLPPNRYLDSKRWTESGQPIYLLDESGVQTTLICNFSR